ncbi:hypothetical protein Btru_074602, partial [Bulinus truncatus]
LEKIKESARIISELTEHEFNRLVINARYFSLAPGRSSMSQGGWSSGTPNIQQNVSDHENDLDLHSPLFCNSEGKYNKDYQDEDSGLASCKLSESFCIESTEDERSSLFENVNYNSKTDLVRITSTFNPPYDEEVKVDSSPGGSSVESPRSETSVTQDEYNLIDEGTEMETLSFKETPIKQSSYHNHENNFWDYMPRANAGEETYLDTYGSSLNSHDTKKTTVHVDKSLNLDLKSKDESKFQHKSMYQSEEDRRKWNTKELSDGHDYLDVNGNPRTKDTSNYPTLRKSPENTIISHLNHGENVPNRKRRNHKKQETTILAENCEGYKGDLPIHELIDYITGHGKNEENSGDVLCKSEKAKKKMEKNRKEKIVCSKVRKKGEISDALHFHETCETIVSLPSSEIQTILLETSEKDKLITNIGPNSMQKFSVELSFKMDIKKTDTTQKLLNCTNSAKFESIPVVKHEPLAEVLKNGGECKDVSKAVGDIIGSADVSSLNCDNIGLSPDIKTEDSFTEVKKKKKKVVSNTTAGYLPSSNSAKAFFNSSGSYNPRARYVSHSTPNSSSAVHSLLVSNHSHSPRDLSPSSFPALPGMPPRLEVRRNSCDGINTVSVDTKNDSDRESVKSLPVTHVTRAIGELSPVHLISYATMVAAPPKTDNVNSSESKVVSASFSLAHTSCGSQVYSTTCGTPEKKPTIWKGSPRERRHSIGSSPEDKNEVDKPNITQRNRQKSGSQELLCRDLESNATFKDSVVSSLQSHLKQENNVKKKKTNVSSDFQLDNEFLADSSSSPVNKISTHSFPSVCLETHFLSTNPPEILQSSEDGCLTEDGMANKEFDPSNDKNSTLVTISTNQFKNTMQASSLSIKTSCPVLEITKKSNTNNHKSVVFLDKRDSDFSSKNLGITFGFDSGFESTNSTSQDVSQSLQDPEESTLPSYHSNSAIASTPVDFHIPPNGGASLASDLHVSSCNNNSPDFKTHQLRNHCNGLIFPSNNTKDELMDKTACDIRTSLCVENKETSSRPPLKVKSSQLPDTSLSSLQNASQNMSTTNNNSSSAELVYSPSYPPPSYSHGASKLAANTPCCYHVNPVTGEQSLKSWEVELPPDIVKSLIPVVYGLKIQPSKGCGKLMFIPPSIKLGANSSAVCSFLKKQWSEVNKHKNSVGSFKTCQDDD